MAKRPADQIASPNYVMLILVLQPFIRDILFSAPETDHYTKPVQVITLQLQHVCFRTSKIQQRSKAQFDRVKAPENVLQLEAV